MCLRDELCFAFHRSAFAVTRHSLVVILLAGMAAQGNSLAAVSLAAVHSDASSKLFLLYGFFFSFTLFIATMDSPMCVAC